MTVDATHLFDVVNIVAKIHYSLTTENSDHWVDLSRSPLWLRRDQSSTIIGDTRQVSDNLQRHHALHDEEQVTEEQGDSDLWVHLG